MAHPKSRVSKAKKNKRRNHHKAAMPQLATCKTTGEAHLMHRAYWHEGSMYYKGQVVIQAKDTEDTEA
ncbi:MAG: 50S ribosomal protein L32 [Saprospiraceae bacterium]|nr:MAG: 50S ribosomal protein L32 [Bacteroidetes bacterium OLB9]MCO6464638.1 50S ribosomal protein L32 [Saprospiraceae bacterium]MCZ2338160.1 50S ribosomal protein L32 [Chitinophagales bacterium]